VIKRTASLVIPALIALVLATGALAGSGEAGSTADAARATAKFHDLAVAKRAGYGLLQDKQGIACIAMDDMPGMGAMGVHYVKKSLIGDDTVRVATPEAVVYAPEGGKLRLAAVEYVVLKSVWDAKHATRPSLFGHAFNVTPDGNRFGLPAFYSLHAWIWKHNRAGAFAMWNPQVSCR
jgi:hypothetical protein